MRRSLLQLIIATGILSACAGCSFLQQSRIPAKWRPYNQFSDDVYRNDFAAVNLDLRKGIDPNKFPDDSEACADELDMAALCIAARNGNIAMINLLLNHGADPNISDGWDGNPLTAAADTDNVAVLQLLVKRGAKINDDSDGSRALWRAATGGKLKALRYLLSHGANPNTTANGDETVLSATELLGQPAAAAILKKYGAKEKLK